MYNKTQEAERIIETKFREIISKNEVLYCGNKITSVVGHYIYINGNHKPENVNLTTINFDDINDFPEKQIFVDFVLLYKQYNKLYISEVINDCITRLTNNTDNNVAQLRSLDKSIFDMNEDVLDNAELIIDSIISDTTHEMSDRLSWLKECIKNVKLPSGDAEDNPKYIIKRFDVKYKVEALSHKILSVEFVGVDITDKNSDAPMTYSQHRDIYTHIINYLIREIEHIKHTAKNIILVDNITLTCSFNTALPVNTVNMLLPTVIMSKLITNLFYNN